MRRKVLVRGKISNDLKFEGGVGVSLGIIEPSVIWNILYQRGEAPI